MADFECFLIALSSRIELSQRIDGEVESRHVAEQPGLADFIFQFHGDGNPLAILGDRFLSSSLFLQTERQIVLKLLSQLAGAGSFHHISQLLEDRQ